MCNSALGLQMHLRLNYLSSYPDSKGLYLCELLATHKYTETDKFHANASFHHYGPLVRFLYMFGDKHSL